MKTLQIFLRRSKATILFSAFILSSIFLVSATIAPSSGVVRLIVREEQCVACGLCQTLAPDCFFLDENGKAQVLVGWEYYSYQYVDALISCPADAIVLDYY